MEESANKRGEQLTRQMDAAQVELRKAVKDYYSSIQKEVDKTTQFLCNYLKDDIEAIRNHRLETYGQNLIGVLIPSLNLSANDVAPHYGLRTRLKFHLAACLAQGDNKLAWISGFTAVHQAANARPTCVQACNLEEKLVRLFPHDIEVVLTEPHRSVQIIAEDLIKKHNMIERFVVISGDNPEINSSEF